MIAMKSHHWFFLLGVLVASAACGQSLSSRSNEVGVRRDKDVHVEFPAIQWIIPAQETTTMNATGIRLEFTVSSKAMVREVSVQSTSMARPQVVLPAYGPTYLYMFSPLMGENVVTVTATTIEGAQAVSTRVITRRAANTMAHLANPPVLTVRKSSVIFSDAGGDGKLDAAEEATIAFVVINEGKTDAKNLGWKFVTDGDSDNIKLSAGPVKLIKAGDSLKLVTKVNASEELQPGIAKSTLVLTEPNGFDSNPVMVGYETVAFMAPEVVLADAMFTSLYSGKMKRNTPTMLRVLVQNNGKGVAEKVTMKIVLPENVLNLGESMIDLGSLKPGQGRKLDIEFIANARYQRSDLPVTVQVSERHGRFGSERTFSASFDEALTSIAVDVRGVSQEVAIGTMLRSLVDVNVPETKVTHPNRYALIIGNEDYMQFQTGLSREQNVAFARNDAMVFKDYAIKTLGCPANQVYLLTDATKGQMSREIQKVTELLKLQPDSELIFYYAGHGLPDFATQKGYLIPVDVSGANVKDGIALGELYSTLASSGASRITVFLDACFSGGGRGENGLLAARTIKIKATGDLVDGNIVVYTAASGEEVSLPLKKESHGLFTYYLLQKLKDSAGVLTMQELKDYLEKEIPKASLIENGMKQTPQVLISPKLNETWNQWQF